MRRAPRQDEPSLRESSPASAAGLGVVVVGVLVLGAVLHSRVPGELSEAPEPQEDLAAVAPPAAIPPPRPPAAPLSPRETIDARAAADAGRLAGEASSFSLQALVACRPETVVSVLERAGGGDDTFVLPAEVDGAPCWRVLWGRFPTRDAARAAELPASLRTAGDPPAPVRLIGDVVP